MPFDFPSAQPDNSTFDFASAQPATDTSVDVNNLGRAAARGIPIIGPLLNKADAATNAAMSTVLPDSVTGAIGANVPGKSFGERYDNALAIQNGMDQGFDQAHPYASDAAQLAGGIGATLAVPLPLPGAAASLPAKMAAGSAVGGAVNGADAYIRSGGDPSAAESGAALGSLVGSAAPVAATGLGRVIGGQLPPVIQSTADFAKAAQAAYKAADTMPVSLTPEAVSALGGAPGQAAIRRALNGSIWNRDANTAAELQSLLPQNGGVISPGATITARTADALHQALGEMSGAASAKGANYVSKGAYDRAVDVDKALQQVPGMAQARALYRTSQNSQLIDQAIQNAQQVAGKNGYAAALQSEFSKLLNNKDAHFDDDTMAAIRKVAYGGSGLAQGLGQITKLTHGFVSNMLALRGIEDNPKMLLPKIAGEIAAPLQGKLLGSQAEGVGQQIRNGGVPVPPRQLNPGTDEFLRRLAITMAPQFALPGAPGQ